MTLSGRSKSHRYTAGDSLRAKAHEDVEDAIRLAKRQAQRAGEASVVYRVPDGAAIATVWPDGKIDLTVEGAMVA